MFSAANATATRIATRTQYKGGMPPFALLFEDVRENCLLASVLLAASSIKADNTDFCLQVSIEVVLLTHE